MTEFERRQQPIQHPMRQERRAPIAIFIGDYLKIKKEYEIKRSCENERSQENDEKESEKEKLSEKEN